MKKQIIDYLNKKLGSKYKHDTKKVSSVVDARVNEGATLEDFFKCIDNKTTSWKGTSMERYLRPETLFSNKFWSYVNETQTNTLESGNRDDLIKAVLKASGMRDINLADVMIYNEVLKLIPTEQLPQFAVSLIRNGGEFMRPDQAISKAVKEFETRILTKSMQLGKKISDYDKFVDFIRYSFRGKPICNNLVGLYKPFVTIGLDRDGFLVNQFIWKKASSQDEELIYKWLYKNQEKVGIVENVTFESEEEPKQIEVQPKDDKKVLDAVVKLTQKVRV